MKNKHDITKCIKSNQYWDGHQIKTGPQLNETNCPFFPECDECDYCYTKEDVEREKKKAVREAFKELYNWNCNHCSGIKDYEVIQEHLKELISK